MQDRRLLQADLSPKASEQNLGVSRTPGKSVWFTSGCSSVFSPTDVVFLFFCSCSEVGDEQGVPTVLFGETKEWPFYGVVMYRAFIQVLSNPFYTVCKRWFPAHYLWMGCTIVRGCLEILEHVAWLLLACHKQRWSRKETSISNIFYKMQSHKANTQSLEKSS